LGVYFSQKQGVCRISGQNQPTTCPPCDAIYRPRRASARVATTHGRSHSCCGMPAVCGLPLCISTKYQ
jgi:hypothetical protein